MKTQLKIISVITGFMVFLTACTPQNAIKAAHSNIQRDLNPSIPDADLTTLVDGNNAFAFDLYRSIRTGQGNEVFSPYSISIALAMTYAGARNETGSQMAGALHFTIPQERLHPAFDKLDLSLTQVNKSTSQSGQPLQLNIVNSLWAEQTYSFLQSFLDLLASNYGAGLQLVDFVNQPEAVRGQINQEVSDQTHQKIKDLIPEGAIDPLTRLVLVNAIYFKGDWEEKFDSNDTSDGAFHVLDGSVTQVKMMSHKFPSAPYTSGDGYKAVELSYSGGSAVMDILVPDEGKFNDFEGQLNIDKFNNILAGLQPTTLDLELPKFSFSSNSDLGGQLSTLGMTDAFDPNKADFSGMTGNRDLFIGKVLHKAFVAVDEKGTEAAAATAVTLGATSILEQNVHLIIDRPFIFVIRDLSSRQILFLGRVVDPSK
jgi:serpin B